MRVIVSYSVCLFYMSRGSDSGAEGTEGVTDTIFRLVLEDTNVKIVAAHSTASVTVQQSTQCHIAEDVSVQFIVVSGPTKFKVVKQCLSTLNILYYLLHAQKSFIIISNLSNDRSKASSKTIPPYSAI